LDSPETDTFWQTSIIFDKVKNSLECIINLNTTREGKMVREKEKKKAKIGALSYNSTLV
jgi:hypothetical protein